MLERVVELLEILAVASVLSSSLESVWMATEEENQEMLMSEAVNTDLVLGGKYLGRTDVRSCFSSYQSLKRVELRCMQ